jgi:hypothetical protein
MLKPKIRLQESFPFLFMLQSATGAHDQTQVRQGATDGLVISSSLPHLTVWVSKFGIWYMFSPSTTRNNIMNHLKCMLLHPAFGQIQTDHPKHV